MRMSIYELFGCFERLPVPINAIAETIRERGFVDRIIFHPVNGDPEILHGFYHRIDEYNPAYAHGNPVRIAHIYYNKHLDLPTRRLTVCKELVHILDNVNYRAETKEKMRELISQIILPTDIQALGMIALTDRSAVVKALQLLFPIAAIEQLRPHFASGRVSDQYLADTAQIPVLYVRAIMSEVWPEIVDIIIKADAA